MLHENTLFAQLAPFAFVRSSLYERGRDKKDVAAQRTPGFYISLHLQFITYRITV